MCRREAEPPSGPPELQAPIRPQQPTKSATRQIQTSPWSVFSAIMRTVVGTGTKRSRASSVVENPEKKMMMRRLEAEAQEQVEDLRASRFSLTASGERPTIAAVDTAIAALLMSGDRHAAIARAASTYGASLGRLCFLLLGVQSEAEEVAQETMLAAYHAASSYRAEGSPRSWFYGIARRICMERLATRDRRSRRSVLLRADSGEHASHASDASVQYDRHAREASLREALDSLPAHDRELLALRFDAEHSFREIAETLFIDEAAARKRVGRALLRLRKELESTPPPAMASGGKP